MTVEWKSLFKSLLRHECDKQIFVIWTTIALGTDKLNKHVKTIFLFNVIKVFMSYDINYGFICHHCPQYFILVQWWQIKIPMIGLREYLIIMSTFLTNKIKELVMLETSRVNIGIIVIIWFFDRAPYSNTLLGMCISY